VGNVQLEIEVVAEARYRFDVVDTGSGIAPDMLDRIFEPFVQDKSRVSQEGTGLGLTIASHYVRLMGGELKVVSEVGKGSQFSFTGFLQRGVSTGHSSENKGRITGLAPGHRVHALVVDDLVENREILSYMLGRIGVSVDLAQNGMEAVQFVTQDMPDVVFLDIWMPVLDGAEAVKQIVSLCGENRPKLVAVTASVMVREKQQYLDAGFDAFLPKPVEAEALYASLKALLGVTYVYEEQGNLVDDFPNVRLPDELWQQLYEAAQLGRVTGLSDCLAQMRELGPQEASVADRLEAMRRDMDIEGILIYLKAIAHE
jgi:CheY-like chemotaxis protein